jgi:Sec7-like guanine-nucleotide exchange factor
MTGFGNVYHAQNEEHPYLPNGEVCGIFAFATLLLNTDRYNTNVREKMTLAQFIRNNRELGTEKITLHEVFAQTSH